MNLYRTPDRVGGNLLYSEKCTKIFRPVRDKLFCVHAETIKKFIKPASASIYTNSKSKTTMSFRGNFRGGGRGGSRGGANFVTRGGR